MPAIDFGFALSSETVAEISETEHHLHNYERWLGLATAPDAEVHRADPIGTSVAPFVADGGGGAGGSWGTWLQVLGSADTPQQTGKTFFDFHLFLITTVERANTIHFIQVGFGASGAAALTAGDYTETVYYPAAVAARAAPIRFIDKRRPVGTKAWVRVFAVGQDTGTVNFFIGLHEYDK